MKLLRPILSLFLIFLTISCSSTKNSESSHEKKEKTILYNHTWQLEYISGIRIAFDGLFPDKKPELAFDSTEHIVRGNSGCNGYSATFTKNGDKISFSDPGPSTLMYCGEGEQQFLKIMKQINRYSIDTDGKLNLLIDDVSMMRFHKL